MNNVASLVHRLDADSEVSRIETTAVATINRSEVEAQLAAAHRYPRSVKRFLEEALSLATLTVDVAESCLYALPRGGKTICGPSVRLAEIIASAYGNLHVAARVLDAEEKEVVAQGVAWDLEKNLRVTVEARRRITNKNGKRYEDDMITVTGAAAGSIALRNAIFRVVPRAYVDTLYASVRDVAVGNAKTLVARRDAVVARLQKIGVPVDRIFARVDAKGIEDVGLEQLEVLIALGSSIKNGERALDDAFPTVDPTPAKSKALEDELMKKAATAAEPATPAAKREPPTTPAKEGDELAEKLEQPPATKAPPEPPPARPLSPPPGTAPGVTFGPSWQKAADDEVAAREAAEAEEALSKKDPKK